jgi:hypothetical protein
MNFLGDCNFIFIIYKYVVMSERNVKSHHQLSSLSSKICFIIDHEYLNFFLVNKK